MRGFTHRAVDRAAGLPEGSTSYYFRTRQALLMAALQRLTDLDTEQVGSLSGVPDLDTLADLVTAQVERWLTVGRERTLARYELTLEAARRPELRAMLVANGARFRVLAQQLLEAAGAADTARRGRDLVAYLDGLVFDQLVGAGARSLDRAELRASCRDLLHALLTACQQDV